MVEQLRRASPLFERLWTTHDVAVRHADRKRILHPEVGLLELDCEVLLTPEHDQRLILHTAAPGTETAEKLELLRVIGLQRLTPESPPRRHGSDARGASETRGGLGRSSTTRRNTSGRL